ncbi:CinA family protein [Natronobacterium gregoryi]|uniref:CinA family protein n=2 Tax=Natronobacterium gregoryi TaxID=44930 RepID=L0AIF5_NATGS|nr:CinA family protein [Natronobacterium gregoryi]AFZ73219.1 competence/damage-inducible protein CinA-like protein [Natronobacterium gregoryi SP2]ELY71323.1 damage inducible protein CinA [Natronobacterium gregoryi SP2]PLK21626.1 CinA family protein [Natronobacterium gregoryi SP2]SFI58144.1 nicotinamide-nucleotide amidase [Natronobacterium gregoryi]
MNDDVDRELPMEVADVLREQDETLAVAESCTGGLIGAAITAVPGASDYFEAGLTTYAYGAKRRELGVSREALDEHGAVSEPVAREMARGVRDVCDVTWGVATTGIAGPTGGTEENPVGTVYIGVAYAGPWGSEASYATVSRYVFDGDRTDIRAKTVDRALETLFETIERTRQ